MSTKAMEVPFDVTGDDGVTVRVVAGPAEVIALEEKFDVSFVQLQTEPRYMWLSFLAWHALKRTGGTAMPWEEWRNNTTVVGAADAAGEG